MEKLNIANKYADLYIHGLCAQLAHEVRLKYPEVKLISIHDHDVFLNEFDEVEEVGTEVLVHMANLLPNGRILDGMYLYDNVQEFQDFMNEEFEELNEMWLATEEESEKMFLLQREEAGLLKELLHYDNPAPEEVPYCKYFDAYMAFIDTIIRPKKVVTEEDIHKKILNVYRSFLESGHGQRYEKILNKNNYSVRTLMMKEPNHRTTHGLFYIQANTRHHEYVRMIVTPFCAMFVKSNGSLTIIYNLQQDNIKDCMLKMSRALKISGVNPNYLEITQSMYMNYVSPLKRL